MKIWPFYGLRYWSGASRPMFLCVTLSSNKLCLKTVKILALKGLKKERHCLHQRYLQGWFPIKRIFPRWANSQILKWKNSLISTFSIIVQQIDEDNKRSKIRFPIHAVMPLCRNKPLQGIVSILGFFCSRKYFLVGR